MNYSDKINSIKEMFDVFDDPMDKYIQIIESQIYIIIQYVILVRTLSA